MCGPDIATTAAATVAAAIAAAAATADDDDDCGGGHYDNTCHDFSDDFGYFYTTTLPTTKRSDFAALLCV